MENRSTSEHYDVSHATCTSKRATVAGGATKYGIRRGFAILNDKAMEMEAQSEFHVVLVKSIDRVIIERVFDCEKKANEYLAQVKDLYSKYEECTFWIGELKKV